MAGKRQRYREDREERRARLRQERIRHRRRIIAAGIGGLLLLLLLAGYLTIYRTVKDAQGDTILAGISIDGVDVSGMTQEEAKEAVDSRVESAPEATLTLKAGDNVTEVQLKQLKLQTDSTDGLVEKAMAYGRTGGILERYKELKSLKKNGAAYYGTYSIDRGTARTQLSETAVSEDDRATDAQISHTGDGTFEITKEKTGISLDMEASLEKIESYLNTKWDCKDGTVKLVTEEEKPSVTEKDLESIQDTLGTYQTEYSTALARAENIANGAGKIDGTVLMPGEEISVEATLSPLTEDNGYVEATAYSSGKVVPSIAGGICQVSSTLYNAVLLAELEVTERYPHSMTVEYVEPSMDAAIAEGTKDFKFKNNLDTPVYIECTTGNGVITATIYGKETRASNRTISFESEIVSTTEPGVTYETSSDYAFGSMQTTSYGTEGKTARLWKIVTVDGKEESRKEVNSSNYAVSNRTITVGTKSGSATAVSILKDAVATQNADTISAAIARAAGQ